MRMKTLKTCSFCAKQVYRIAGHGLCAACYYREKRNGTPDYVKVRKPCSIAGCEGMSIAQGMCETHYRRWKRHGVAEHERFDRWGHKEGHPLANTYYWARRTYRDAFPRAWDDFWQFVRDVGDRPAEGYRLVRKDRAKPYSAENVEWRAPRLEVSVQNKEGAAEYARAHRAANPDSYRDQHLRKKYGVTLDWYREQLGRQNGVCALCRQPETSTHQKTGLPREYAVDHCHTAGHVRALLCAKCNRGLGLFRDDPALLRAAADYLERHAKVA